MYDGLQLPTALAYSPEGKLYVAQLAGGENAANGQILLLEAGKKLVVLEGLFKPTGLAWRDDQLYIAAGPELLRSRPLDDESMSQPETLVQDLARNGRSAGHVTLLPDGALLFEQSGSVSEDETGRLFVLPPGSETAQEIARGLKNSYAHTVGPDGTIYVSDVGEDPVDGTAPPEEINVLFPNADYGWPH
ncbi:glucose sorbosone dehydrogenase, partial [Candidatus Gracilibacteria bacterium]|nr:glucose sorbosone dehydrogenase [Candidatus Gracilibacteria bacterium]